MNQVLTKRSAKMVCGALLASICTVAAPQEASAEPILVGVTTGADDGVSAYSVLQGVHQYGTQGQNIGGFYHIVVSSPAPPRPGFQYSMVIDYNPYDPGFFLQFGINYLFLQLDIKQPGAPDPITNFFVKDGNGNPLSISNGGIQGGTDGGSIFVNMNIVDVLNGGGIVIVQWNQLPAPGALTLLGVAGAIGGRRRRRS